MVNRAIEFTIGGLLLLMGLWSLGLEIFVYRLVVNGIYGLIFGTIGFYFIGHAFLRDT